MLFRSRRAEDAEQAGRAGDGLRLALDPHPGVASRKPDAHRLADPIEESESAAGDVLRLARIVELDGLLHEPGSFPPPGAAVNAGKVPE